jgi:hypothetical protein
MSTPSCEKLTSVNEQQHQITNELDKLRLKRKHAFSSWTKAEVNSTNLEWSIEHHGIDSILWLYLKSFQWV